MPSSNGDDVPPIVHAVSSAVASIFSNSFVYPLDLITTRLQTQDKKKKNLKSKSGTALTHDKNYDGLAHALFTIYEDEGAASLWQGVWADNVSTMASTFCYHFAYNYIRDKRMQSVARKNGGKRPDVLGIIDELSIGAAAGVLARFATSPASNIVTRSQTQGGSTTSIVKDIYKEKGVTGFWSGMKASVILAAIPSVSYYLFEVQKALFVPKSRRGEPKAIEIFLMSATGKAIATLLLYPVVLLKVRTQAVRMKMGLWELVKSILEKDGVAGLYEGAIPQVLKGFLSQGILMLLKDRIATLIISGYLAINKRRRTEVSSGYYFSDTPKTDVNGLIAATKDSVQVAVDQAVDKVKEVGADIANSVDLEGNYEKAKDLAQSARDSVGVDDAVEKAREVAQSAADTVSSNETVGKLKDMAQSAGASVSANVGEVVKAATELIKGQDTSDKPVRAVSNAVSHGTKDAPEWSNQKVSDLNSTSVAAKISGVEWSGQTKKPTDR